MRLETQVAEVSQNRYTFLGLATLGAQTYNVEGVEEVQANLGYSGLAPQAAPPPSGFLEMTLSTEDGTFAYGLCTMVYYGSDRIDTPYTFDGATLYAKEGADTPLCNFSEPVAAVMLEKLRR